MKFLSLLISILILNLSFPASAAVRWFNDSDTQLGILSSAKCSTGISCAVTSGKLVITSTNQGVLQNQIASSATTLTKSQCGSTIVSGGAHTMNLPEASTVLGCRFTFIVGAAQALVINPDNADQILLLTDSAGDSISADAAGESVTIEAISSSQWAPVGAEKGTWSDAN